MYRTGGRNLLFRIVTHEGQIQNKSGIFAGILWRRPRLSSHRRFLCEQTAGKTGSSFEPSEISGDSNSLYLHVGPSGDFWTGHSIFAAKHLQPDYVKSVLIDPTIDVDKLLDLLEDDDDGDGWARDIYDNGEFPKDLCDKLQEGKERSTP